jgi:hypothetical protein
MEDNDVLHLVGGGYGIYNTDQSDVEEAVPRVMQTLQVEVESIMKVSGWGQQGDREAGGWGQGGHGGWLRGWWMELIDLWPGGCYLLLWCPHLRHPAPCLPPSPPGLHVHGCLDCNAC